MSPKRFLTIVAAAVLATCSFAQSADSSVPPEEFILATSSPDRLLQRQDVQDDLDLTTEQRLKFYDAEALVAAQVQAQTQAESQAADPSTDTPPTPPQPTYDAVRRRMLEHVDRILTPAQMKRLKQIAIQLSGYSALTHAEVQRELDLPKETVFKIADLAAEEHAADSAVFDKYENGDITADKIPEIVKKNRLTLNTEIGKLLTAAQKDQFKSLSGKPFKSSAT